ncbi:MAG: hypothetical protein KJ061_00310 [Vicinamibacteraceae bacterium]|nr:hypothetical protein [Vicinamibacteraceae bacterium]
MDERTPQPAEVVEDGPVETAAAPGAAASPDPESPSGSPSLPAPEAVPPGAPQEMSPAWARFTSCRWHRAAEGGTPAHCTHRDVFPLAGVHGFNPESWCPDCPYYKLRRTVRKPRTY